MAKETFESLLARIERWLVMTAIALAVGAWFYDHKAFVCVFVSGLFVAANFRLWRIIGNLAKGVPGILYVALALKVPLLALGIYWLLKLGQPWMVALGSSNLLFAMILSIYPKPLRRGRTK